MADTKASMQVVSADAIDEINDFLFTLADSPVPTPEEALSTVRQTLERFGVTLPSMYDLDTEGQEFVINLTDDYFLYFAYSMDDDGTYIFHAEITDQEGVNEILALDDEEDEDEEE